MNLKNIFEELSKDAVDVILQRNPDFFKGERYFGTGVKHGAFDFVLKMDPDDVNRYVDGDWTIRRWKDKDGRERSIGLFETILSGDAWELWERNGYDGDWEGVIDYHINQENENIVRDILNKLIIKNGYNPEDFNDNSLQDMINELDDDHHIRSAMSSALSDAEGEEYVDYLREQLKDACEELGEVIKFDDVGVEIKIDFQNYVTSIYGDDYHKDDEVLDYMERCDWDPDCFITETQDYTDKPKFSSDDRWYPSIDDNNFNSILGDRLGEVPYEYGLE